MQLRVYFEFECSHPHEIFTERFHGDKKSISIFVGWDVIGVSQKKLVEKSHFGDPDIF